MIGETISHYKIIEKLGEGGMGIVFKAEDTKLHRPVALKFLPSSLTSDSEAKERFIKEARAASALDHPNICTIHEINETEDEQMFISMACYEGMTLTDKIAKEQISIDEVIDIATQTVSGLTKAHQRGIIHRDIKPANLVVTEDGHVKILDFGIAKLIGESKSTQENLQIGTIAHVSPEQIKGENFDHRTDIWSLGVVMYEMLTARLPFEGEYDQAIIYSILNEEPTPIKEIRNDVPGELNEIVIKCLRKKDDDRYQSADELLKALINCMESQRNSGRTVGEPESSERQRKLSAIMFTDMVGYTALMQTDEHKAKKNRDRHRKVMEKLIQDYHGLILQYYGDGTLSVFGSAIDAVECAVKIQRELQKNPKIPSRPEGHHRQRFLRNRTRQRSPKTGRQPIHQKTLHPRKHRPSPKKRIK